MDTKIVITSSLLVIAAVGLSVWTYKKNTSNLAPKLDDVKNGDALYPLGNNVNVRSSASVESNNYIYPNYVGKIGTVIGNEIGTEGKVWYKVKLDKPKGNFTEGFVRIDVVKKGV